MNSGDDEAAAALRRIGEQLEIVWKRIVEAIQPAVDHLQSVGFFDDLRPTDPRKRALWLRQHRNTGPATVPYAKRRPR